MNRYSVTLETRFDCDDADRLDAFTDALYDRLLALDPTADMGGSLAGGVFEFTVEVDAVDAVAAGALAAERLRSAAGAVAAGPEAMTQRTVRAREVLAPAG